MVQWSPAYELEIGEVVGSTFAMKHSVFYLDIHVLWSKKYIF